MTNLKNENPDGIDKLAKLLAYLIRASLRLIIWLVCFAAVISVAILLHVAIWWFVYWISNSEITASIVTGIAFFSFIYSAVTGQDLLR